MRLSPNASAKTPSVRRKKLGGLPHHGRELVLLQRGAHKLQAPRTATPEGDPVDAGRCCVAVARTMKTASAPQQALALAPAVLCRRSGGKEAAQQGEPPGYTLLQPLAVQPPVACEAVL